MLLRSRPVVLPESNLAVQLFLRNAPYRAVRVLRGYYGDEDGYFMAQASPWRRHELQPQCGMVSSWSSAKSAGAGGS